jgi:hypothetical protein
LRRLPVLVSDEVSTGDYAGLTAGSAGGAKASNGFAAYVTLPAATFSSDPTS